MKVLKFDPTPKKCKTNGPMESSIAKPLFLGKMMVFAKIEVFDRPDGVRTKNLKNEKSEKMWKFLVKNLFWTFLTL